MIRIEIWCFYPYYFLFFRKVYCSKICGRCTQLGHNSSNRLIDSAYDFKRIKNTARLFLNTLAKEDA